MKAWAAREHTIRWRPRALQQHLPLLQQQLLLVAQLLLLVAQLLLLSAQPPNLARIVALLRGAQINLSVADLLFDGVDLRAELFQLRAHVGQGACVRVWQFSMQQSVAQDRRPITRCNATEASEQCSDSAPGALGPRGTALASHLQLGCWSPP